MKILISYASNSGNTMLAARRIGQNIRKAGHTVAVQDVVDTSLSDVSVAEVVVLGACTWLTEGKQGQLPSQGRDFVTKLTEAGALPGKPFAVFGFGRHEYTNFCAAAELLEHAVEHLDGRLVVPTLRVDGYYQHNVDHLDTWARVLVRAIKDLRPTKARL